MSNANIGNVAGGIHEAIIAGRDVTINVIKQVKTVTPPGATADEIRQQALSLIETLGQEEVAVKRGVSRDEILKELWIAVQVMHRSNPSVIPPQAMMIVESAIFEDGESHE